jgi:hypothetical protein
MMLLLFAILVLLQHVSAYEIKQMESKELFGSTGFKNEILVIYVGDSS